MARNQAPITVLTIRWARACDHRQAHRRQQSSPCVQEISQQQPRNADHPARVASCARTTGGEAQAELEQREGELHGRARFKPSHGEEGHKVLNTSRKSE